jgi:hypothetical protein
MTSPAPAQEIASAQHPAQPPASLPGQSPAQAMSLTDRILIASDLGATVEEAKEIINSLRGLYKIMFGDAAWEVGEPIPGNPALAILAAFNSDFLSNDTDGLDRVAGDCRFYVIPTAGITDPLAPVFACYTLNRGFPTTIAEKMTLETFVREVGREWYNLAIVQGIIEEPDDEEE